MKRYYCTYFDRNYLVRGLALMESLAAHETRDYTLFAICLDEISRVIVEGLGLPRVATIPLHEIERGDDPLLATRSNRSLVEYYWTLTPTVIRRLMDRYPEIDALAYLDADLYFYSSPEPIFAEFRDHSILIHEHRFPPALGHLAENGRFNVGLLIFGRDEPGEEALDWWRQRCIEWCYARVEDGKFGDQLYLEDWPRRFARVRVLEHIGAGVAPWNHEQYRYACDGNGRVSVNGMPLIFYHFHALAFVSPGIIIPAKHLTYPLTEEILRLCFIPYVKALTRAIEAVKSLLPDFSFGLNDGSVLTTEHTFVARKTLAAVLRNAGIPHPSFSIDSEWDCYRSSQLVEPGIVRAESPTKKVSTPVTATELNRRGEEFFASNDIRSALEMFTRALELDPASPPILNNLGVLYWKSGNAAKALNHLSRAIESNQDYSPAILNAAMILEALGNAQEARLLFERYLNIIRRTTRAEA
ncbi:MAG: tetratricopeptide repeat protein [Syntrophobacteraceae bacterium]|nr:tetratricopeptide repeat protein [Syntrophobacteraceae bacterium]